MGSPGGNLGVRVAWRLALGVVRGTRGYKDRGGGAQGGPKQKPRPRYGLKSV